MGASERRASPQAGDASHARKALVSRWPLKSKHSVQLRMIRGPQEGARITLQPGSYKLGGFESGDILLCEDNLDEKPMVLEIAQGARGPVVRIRAADGVGAAVGGAHS
jgi:hypothetical protein